MRIAMIGREIIGFEQLDKAYLDRGIFFGDGVYEVVRSYGGRIFAMDDHLARFERSLGEVDITGVGIDDVRWRVEEAFERASIADAKIYFHVTRGSAERNHAGGEELRPNFFLTVTEIGDHGDQKANGVSVSTVPDWRWKRCDIKSLNLLANVLARRDAEKKGCREAILVNERGEITEGSSSAIFMVCGGGEEIVTRPLGCDILPSITRKVVCEIAGNAGVGVVERAFSPDDAKGADELFIAVTTQDIVPVVEFDGVRIGAGSPGACTKKLMGEFAKMIR